MNFPLVSITYTVLSKAILIMSFVLAGCLDVSKSKSSPSNSFDKKSVLKLGTEGNVVLHSGATETHIGTLNVLEASVEYPDYLINGIYGDRSTGEEMVDLSLSFRYRSTQESHNGDFLYEVPIFKSGIYVNSLSSSLYWFLLNQFKNSDDSPVLINLEIWNEMIETINAFCPKCYSYKASNIVEELRKASLSNNIKEVLKGANAKIQFLSEKALADYKEVYFSENHNFSGGNLSINAAEGDRFQLDFFIFHLLDSNKEFKYGLWNHSYNSVELYSGRSDTYNYNFSYAENGTHIITKKIPVESKEFTVSVSVDVGNTNLPPVLGNIPAQSFQQNHEKTIDFVSYTSDPDGDTNLRLRLLSGPTGLVVAGTVLTWNPLSGQLGDYNAIVYLEDSGGATSSNFSIPLNVVADNAPSLVSVPGTLGLSEGTESFFDIEVEDLDGDSLEAIVTNPDFILSGEAPSSSGWLSSPLEKQVTGNTTRFRFYLTPSYLEVLTDAQKSISFDINIDYDSNVTSLRDFNTITVTVNADITNVDDPPEWSVQPAQIYATETVPFTSSALAGGTVVDSSYNPTALSFSLDNQTPFLCPGISINSSSGELSVTPNYTFPLLCPLTITATDSNSLSRTSDVFYLETSNTNRLPSISSSMPSVYNVAEGESLSININDYFSDPDMVDGDAREIITYTCGNCLTKNLDLVIPSSGQIDWEVPYNQAGTYTGVRIQYQDKYMYDNSVTPLYQDVDIVISESPAPVKFVGLASSIEISENSSSSVSFDVEAFSATAVDYYNYTLSMECGNCPNGMVAFQGGVNTGNSTNPTSFNLDLNPDYDAGNASSGYRIYQVKLIAVSDTDSDLKEEIDLQIKVLNVNRVPSALILTENSVPDSGTGVYQLDIDLSQNANRFIERTLELSLDDPDASFDTFSFSFHDTDNFPSIGEIDGAVWKYTPLGCSTGGEENLQRTFKISGSDSGGNQIVRTIELNLNSTTGSGICP